MPTVSPYHNILETYIALHQGILFNTISHFPFATVCLNSTEPFPFWNTALVHQNLPTEQIEEVEKYFNSNNRKPSFYFEQTEELEPFRHLLIDRNYYQDAEESFLFHDGTNIHTNTFDQVQTIHKDHDFELFLHTLNNSFTNQDPLNPYGELGQYLETVRKSWELRKRNRSQFFLVFDNERPVAVSTLTNVNGVGFISNVGSLPEVRGRGFGKIATLCAVQASVENKNSSHFLLTDVGTNAYEFYLANGFKVGFTTTLLTQSSAAQTLS